MSLTFNVFEDPISTILGCCAPPSERGDTFWQYVSQLETI